MHDIKHFAAAVWCVLCLGFFLLRAQAFIHENSATFDEAVHLSAGYSYWERGDFRLNHETPPLSKLIAAFPLFLIEHPRFEPTPKQWEDGAMWEIGNQFLFRNSIPPREMLAWGRRATLSLGIALVAMIGWWSYRRCGLLTGCLALGIAATEPNLLAFSCLVSSDMCLTLFTFASAYCSWEYFQCPSRKWFVWTGICMGLSIASKFSALFFIPGLAVCWWLNLRNTTVPVVRETGDGDVRSTTVPVVRGTGDAADSASRASGTLALRFTALFRLLLISGLTLLPCYFFLQLPQLGEGFKQQISRNGFEPPEFFLNGEISTTGWYGYFVAVLRSKVDVAIWLLLILRICLSDPLNRMGAGYRNFVQGPDSVLLLPAAGFFVAMSLLKVDLGIRIVLPVLPFVLMMAAAVPAANWNRIEFKALLGLPLLLMLGQFLHFQKYPGEEIGACSGIIPRILSQSQDDCSHRFGDSNLDWGQDMLRLKEWLDERNRPAIYLAYVGTSPAEFYGIDTIPLPGWGRVEPYPNARERKADYAAVSVSCLQGLHLKDRAMYRDFLEYEPVSRLGGAIWIYDIRDKPALRDAIEGLAEQAKNGK